MKGKTKKTEMDFIAAYHNCSKIRIYEILKAILAKQDVFKNKSDLELNAIIFNMCEKMKSIEKEHELKNLKQL